ncbi:MAG TPA: YraN family protein [Thiopseudomonas sp.]|nr:YraN family protein [Thiopseudomonas sp.]
MTKAIKIGKAVEQFALNYLIQAGLSTIAQNWSCRFGEIDLIMLEHDTLVFVEVRYRKSNRFGGALESIDQSKREKLLITTELFFNQYPHWLEHDCRFDVITAHPSATEIFTLDWIQDAFES